MGFTDFIPVIGNVLDAGSQLGSAAINAREAQKNREFQEKMYEKQKEDNIVFWNMQNEYNLPSAVRQRYEDAGLNSLLMYGQGGTSMATAGAISSAQAPHGAQGSANLHTNFGQGLTQAALLSAQIRNLNSVSEKNEAEAENVETDTRQREIDFKFSSDTFELRKAIQYGNMELINQELLNMRQDLYNGAKLNAEQCMTLAQGREFERKRYSLTAEQVGNSILQEWRKVVSGEKEADAAVRNSFANMMKAVSEVALNKAQIGSIALEMAQKREMFPYLLEEQRIKNRGFRLDNLIKGQEVGIKKLQKLQTVLESHYLFNGAPKGSFAEKYLSPFFAPKWRKGSITKALQESMKEY